MILFSLTVGWSSKLVEGSAQQDAASVKTEVKMEYEQRRAHEQISGFPDSQYSHRNIKETELLS